MKKSLLTAVLIISGLAFYYFYPEIKLNEGQKADKIIINKTNHELLLFQNDELLATYKVSLSKKGLSKKTREGDNLTPEGLFKGKKRSYSNYHKAIEIGEWGKCCNVLIHGQGQKLKWAGKFHRWIDLTDGCVMVTNDEIDEIYAAVKNGVIIEINQ